MDRLTEEIIDIEWAMFSRVQNEGGRASCQEDPETFRIMRASQFDAWDVHTLQSYLADLHAAQAAGRNLLTEKYAYMMRDSHPAEFEKIRDRLPPVPEDKQELIEDIVRRHIAWKASFNGEYPLLAGVGRPTLSQQDASGFTSSETYLRGELTTYSTETLLSYNRYLDRLEAEGQNIVRMITLNTVRAYGYRDLDHAEQVLRQKVD